MSVRTFTAIPQSFEEFCSLPEAAMLTPDDTAALAILAFCVYPTNREASLKMIDYLRGPRPMSVMDKQFVRDRFFDKDYVPRSHFDGATPNNDYTPSLPYTVTLSENPHSRVEDGYVVLFARSGGADSPRPIKMRLGKDGKWYLWEYSSILTGIRIPESENPWA